MNKLILTLILSICPIAVLAQECRVVGVADGDTLTCLTPDKTQIKVRLNQIDAPEKTQAFGQAAKEKLSDLVFGKPVYLRIDGKDRYGRTLAQVFLGKININKEMVGKGYAWAYRQYVTDSEYLRLEAAAKSARLGLWSQPNPTYPSDFRKGQRPTGNGGVLPQNQPQKASFGKTSCGNKRFCKQMASCEEAKFYLNQCGLNKLDGDGDGIPCESLCR